MPLRYAFYGRKIPGYISQNNYIKAFIAGTGLSLDFGLSNTNIAEASVKQAMLRAAREVALLADHTKIGTESLVRVAPLESIHRLITDAGMLQPQMPARIKETNIFFNFIRLFHRIRFQRQKHGRPFPLIFRSRPFRLETLRPAVRRP